MPSVVVRRHQNILEIVLNRPEVLNAADRGMIGELAAATAEAAEVPWPASCCCAAPGRISAPAATSTCSAS